MKQIHFLALLLLTSLLQFSVPHAIAQDQERYTQLRLVPERTTVQAGKPLTIAVEQIIAPHWHTYWKNPGDSGAAPVFTWDIPQGWQISDITFPMPEKIPYGPLLNYGYSNYTALLQTLTPPDNYDGAPVTITADLEVLVCKDICIPEYDTFTLTLNDSASQTNNASFIQDAQTHLPRPIDTKASFSEANNNFIARIDLPANIPADQINQAWIIPEAWGAIVNADPVHFDTKGQELTLTQTRGEQPFNDFASTKALIGLIMKDGSAHNLEITAQIDPKLLAQTAPQATDHSVSDPMGQTGLESSILLTLVFAFIGGLILNLMPCVFPILSIKTLSLVQMAQHNPSHARTHGLAYLAGVTLSFVAIAGALIVLQLGGAQVGWGFQLQNPLIVGALSYLLFVVGLNFAGVFEIGHGLSNVGSDLASKKGTLGAFFTGVLATIVATPCTAPFMATAVGVAFTQPPIVSLLIFATLGVGLAFPYVLLAFVPALQAALPKPGAWMRTFQQALAFPMFLAVAWLLWVLAQQVGDSQLFSVMLGLVAIGFGLWAWSHSHLIGKTLALAAFAAALYGLPAIAQKVDAGSCYHEQARSLTLGEEFSTSTLEYYLNKTDRPVFVEMTAAWCITCKLNHASSIDIESTRDLFYREDVAFLVGDWTNQDSDITKYLHSFGRNGVPLYVFYPAPIEDGVRPNPVILPQLLTPSIVDEHISATYMDH